jgi:hypothetical protein
MIIFLGRRLPGASSDLPEGRNGPGRSVCNQAAERRGEPRRLTGQNCTAPLFGLAPDGVYRARPVTRPAGELLPHRFTLTAAEAQAPRPRRFLFCGTFPIRRPREATADGGRYPPSRPSESGLSSAACPSTRAFKAVSRPSRTNQSAPAIIAPATDLSLECTLSSQKRQLDRQRLLSPAATKYRAGKAVVLDPKRQNRQPLC